MELAALWPVSTYISIVMRKAKKEHYTYCSTAAIAARVAQGADIPTAVRGACRYIEAGIKTAPQLGSGNGPLDHFHSTYTLPFSP